jgi:hypothetical protein
LRTGAEIVQLRTALSHARDVAGIDIEAESLNLGAGSRKVNALMRLDAVFRRPNVDL